MSEDHIDNGLEKAEPGPVDKIVDTWFSEFRGSPVSRHTEAWNFFQEKITDLKARLRTLL